MNNELSSNFEFQALLRRRSSGELTDSEATALQEWLSLSAEAEEEALFSDQLTTVLAHKDMFAVSALVAEVIHNEPLPPMQRPARGRLLRMVALASVIIVAGWIAFSGYRAYTTNLRHQSIYEAHFTLLEDVLFVQTRDSQQSALSIGMNAYKQGDYDQAIQQLGAYYIQTEDPYAGLYLSVSMLMKKRSKEASAILNQIIPRLDGPALEAALWYASLAALSQVHTEDVLLYLQKLPPNSIYSAQALELRRQIKLK